ncbi:MAG TPA: 2'-5' RNA ligase family protein [Marmoricola sp.]
MPTIGVSVAVPDPWGAQLQEYRVALGDDSAALIPSHITLLPPSEVAEADMAGVVRHLEDAARQAAPFRIHLRGTGTFRPVSPVVFVGVVAGISSCEQLAKRIRSGPLVTEVAFPYHPHVTVAHHLDDVALDKAFAELAGFECEFEAEEFWLYEHDQHAGWRPTHSFPLTASG